jgi:hypothetical protein
MQKMLLRVICVCVLLIILTAGLWPFHAPRNDVSWLSQGNGLRFGKHGSILSANPFAANELRADKACSLEIWLEPNLSNSRGTVLAFYWPASKVVSFSLRQWRDGLVLERQSHGHATEASIYVADVFRGPSPVVFAISSGEAGAAIYVDGTLVRNFPDFKLTSRDLSGELVVGNGPLTTYNWSGQIKGLAVYDRGLLPAEVAQDHANWTAAGTIGGPPDPAERESMVARFRFDEGKGNVVHNQVDTSTNLLIPERFFVFHEQFLELPWDEFQSRLALLEERRDQRRRLHSAGFLFSGVFLCGWKDQAGNSAHHCAGIPRQPHDRSAAGISSDPRLRSDRPHYQHIRDGPRSDFMRLEYQA